MVSKEAIKECIENNLSIGCWYKRSVDDWRDDITINKRADGKYLSDGRIFDSVDDAVDNFIQVAFSSENYGYLEKRLINKKLLDAGTELEFPDDETIKLFEEEKLLVEAEYIKFYLN